MKRLVFIFGMIITLCSCKENQKPIPPKEITINAYGNTMTEMRYDVTEIRVQKNQKIKLILNNRSTAEEMQHNIVFVYSGKAEQVALAGISAGQSKSFVPESDNIIAASVLIAPGESTTLEFSAPTERGEYEFICTYPGHFNIMKGKMIVE